VIEKFADWLTYSVFNLSQESVFSESVNFFVYDSIKILLLILVVTHFMGVVKYYLPVAKIRKFLTSHKFYGTDYFFAAVFGAITPFCSCSSIPLFIGFLEARIPLGITLAFLVTSPLINEVAIALFIGMFGWQVTLIYITAGLGIGMMSGFILSRFNLEKYIEEFVWKEKQIKVSKPQEKESASYIIKKITSQALRIFKKVTPYVLVGVGIGAFIHGYVPDNYFEQYIQADNIWAVPLAVILAVPMYSNASGVIPIVQSLVVKGVPLGTALAFMMAVVGLSLPEAMILKKVMKWPLLSAFFDVVSLGIIVIGFIFNIVF